MLSLKIWICYRNVQIVSLHYVKNLSSLSHLYTGKKTQKKHKLKGDEEVIDIEREENLACNRQ